MIDTSINIILFIMLVVTAFAIIRMDKLFAVVMLMGQKPALWGWEKWPRHGSTNAAGGIPEQ